MPERIPFLEVGGYGGSGVNVRAVLATEAAKVLNHVVQRSEIAGYAVGEIADLMLPAKFELKTPVADETEVLHHRGCARDAWRCHGDQQVSGSLVVVIDRCGEPVAEESHIHAEVELDGFLPLEARIGKT